MPNTYVRKAEREWQAQINKSVQTLLALCDDPTANPETKLGAVKLLRPIQQLQQQLHIKDEQISQKDEEIRELKKQLERMSKEFDEAHKQLEAALEDKRAYEKQIKELETDNKELADEHTGCNEQLTRAERERGAAIDRAERAEAAVESVIKSLEILVDEFVPAQERHSTALRQFDAHGTRLSSHWYELLDLNNALRHKTELKKLTELIAQARKQERPWRPGIVYLTSDAEVFGDIFLYQLLVQRDKWLEKSLVDFFQSEGADYSKWLNWDSGESSATGDEIERRRFGQARHDYRTTETSGQR